MKTHFENKEHYLNFRKAWAAAVTSPLAKPTYKTQTFKHWKTGSLTTVVSKEHGWITLTHHMLYNILRNKPITMGFTAVTNKNKLAAGMDPNYSARLAHGLVGDWIRRARFLDNDEHSQPWGEFKNMGLMNDHKRELYTRQLEQFFKVFDGTVTTEMLANIELPEFPFARPTIPTPIQQLYNQPVAILPQTNDNAIPITRRVQA